MGEGEADPGDGLGRLDYGSGDASRPGSDSADVSVLHFHFVVFFSTAPLPDLIVSYRTTGILFTLFLSPSSFKLIYLF